MLGRAKLHAFTIRTELLLAVVFAFNSRDDDFELVEQAE